MGSTVKLQDYLDANGLSQSAFAKKIGVTQATVSRWVDGHARPRWPTMARISLATGNAVTANDFVEDGGGEVA